MKMPARDAGRITARGQLRASELDGWETKRGLLAAIVETSEDAIVSKDLEGIVTSWNASAERIYGWKAEEIIGKSKGLVIPPDLPDELPTILGRIRSGQRIEHYETQRIRKDGTRIDVAISVSPVKNATGKIVGAATIVRDITAQVRARHEIEALNARLRRAMQETHHRVKNNLQVVAAMVDMQILERSGASVPVEELSRLGAHIRMLAAVHDALTHYLHEDEKAACLSASNVFQRLVPLLQITAGREEVKADLDELFLTGKQASALALIANELVSNAVKHGKGPIRVHLEHAPGGGILSIKDAGPGFPVGFDAAQSANTGLELVDTLAVTDLRGKVSFANDPQGGARVTVTMTLGEEQPEHCPDSESGRIAA